MSDSNEREDFANTNNGWCSVKMDFLVADRAMRLSFRYIL